MQFKWEKIGIQTRVDKNQLYIFDPFRKRHILATPEEEVRQFTLYTLCTDKGYPANAIAVERQITYLKRKKRFDAMVYLDGQPIALIECKAAHIPLKQAVFNQVCEYNFVLRVPYLMITNGHSSICARVNHVTKKYEFIHSLPDYNSLSN